MKSRDPQDTARRFIIPCKKRSNMLCCNWREGNAGRVHICVPSLKPWEECWKSESQNHLHRCYPHQPQASIHLTVISTWKNKGKNRPKGEGAMVVGIFLSTPPDRLRTHMSQFPHHWNPAHTGRYREPTRTYQRPGMTVLWNLGTRNLSRLRKVTPWLGLRL